MRLEEGETMFWKKDQLIKDMKAIGIGAKDRLLARTSMRSIGPVEGGGDTVIDALLDAVSEGMLILPTHTWKQVGNDYPIFNPKTEPSCVGILTNLFLHRPGVIRSLHPTHSVAAFGQGAEAFVSGEEQWDTPCPRGGCWGKMVDLGVKILFLGCTLNTNTMLHGVEEWRSIPNRLTHTHQKLQIVMEDGRFLDRPMRRHHNPSGDVSNNYGKILPALREKGIAQEGMIGDAHSVLCDARPMVALVTRFLEKDPDLFLHADPIPQEWYAKPR